MNEHYDVLIVGAGCGGAQTAITLHKLNFTGSIALFGEEPEPPYERPPLSKEYLAGDKPFERLLVRPAAFWPERHIALHLGELVTEVDPAAHRVRTRDGPNYSYGKLVWAAGGAPRRLSAGHELRGVHTLRTRADVDRIRAELALTQDVAIIGAGYIGLEAAAVLTKLGKRVTVLEAQDRVLARVAGEPLSRWFEAEHRAHGVELRLSAIVVQIEARDGHACGVRLASGERVAAEMVLVGVGIVPAVQPLTDAGAAGDNGVRVDLQGLTTLIDVYALGDCAAYASVHAHGSVVRLESVQNANDQGAIVAKAIIGSAERYQALPWFWSNQYDVRLQTVGLSHGYDELVVRGSLSERSFSLVYLRGGKVIALDCVNAVKDFVQGKAVILAGREADRAQLADPGRPMMDPKTPDFPGN